MPSTIVRQPDGLLAAFTTVAEDFFAWGMTEAEANELCMDDLGLGKAAAVDNVRAGVTDLWPHHASSRLDDGLNRWRHVLSMMALNKTRADVAARLAEMGFADQDLSGLAFPSEDTTRP